MSDSRRTAVSCLCKDGFRARAPKAASRCWTALDAEHGYPAAYAAEVVGHRVFAAYAAEVVGHWVFAVCSVPAYASRAWGAALQACASQEAYAGWAQACAPAAWGVAYTACDRPEAWAEEPAADETAVEEAEQACSKSRDDEGEAAEECGDNAGHHRPDKDSRHG